MQLLQQDTGRLRQLLVQLHELLQFYNLKVGDRETKLPHLWLLLSGGPTVQQRNKEMRAVRHHSELELLPVQLRQFRQAILFQLLLGLFLQQRYKNVRKMLN